MYYLDNKCVYLVLDCKCELESTGQTYSTNNSFCEKVNYKNFDSIYWINSSVPNDFIEGAFSSFLNDTVKNTNLSNSEENCLFIYNPDLSDEFTNKMGQLISNRILNIYGVLLIISKSEVQGIIIAVTLSNRLSKLALLNLIKKCRTLCHKNMETCSWRQDLHCNDSISDLIIYTFIGFFYKIVYNHCKSALRIAIKEKDVLIAHNINHNIIKNLLTTNKSTRTVYISNCDIPSAEYEILCQNTESIYIYNGHVTEHFFKRVSIKSSVRQVFIHNLTDISPNATIFNDYLQRCSVLFVTNNAIIGNRATSEQLALALHLLPSIKVLKLHNCQRNYNTFSQIQTIIANNFTPLQLQELDISDNYFQLTDVITISKAFQSISTLTKLFIRKNNITEKAAGNIAALISCNIQLQELDISDNYLQSTGVIIILKALQGISTLTKLFISKNGISKNAANKIAALISCNTQLQELDIGENYLQSIGVITVSKALQGIFTLTKLFINKNGITKSAASNIAAVISCNNQLQELDISDNHLQSTGIVTVSKALEGISTLTKLLISKNNITEKAASNIAAVISYNTQLHELDISNNYLLSTGITIISKALQSISKLTKLFISKNNITEKAANNIAALFSCNTQLQQLDISNNYLKSTGFTTISKALQSISSLTK